MHRPCRVALAGFGTVGRSAVRLLQRVPADVELVAILNRRVSEKRVDWVDRRTRWTDSFDDLLGTNPDVLVELIGGREPAAGWIGVALDRGISVVTANKQVMAHEGPALVAAAGSHAVQLRYEAAVGGVIPIVGAIQGGLASDTLAGVAGILNGTCNYILTRMEQEGIGFDEALREAQALGFAEADPSQDIDGSDARAKLTILAMAAFGLQAAPSSIEARSIAAVHAWDFQFARRLNRTIRQIAWAARDGRPGHMLAAVGPALVPLTSPLARVTGAENLVTITGSIGGETRFGGSGAGGDPTAVAVVSDVLAIARGARPAATPPPVPVEHVSSDASAPCYVRFTVAERPGIMDAMGRVFTAHGIHVNALLQEPGFPAESRPFVVTLGAAPWSAIDRALTAIATMDFHAAPPVAMPIVAGASGEPSA